MRSLRRFTLSVAPWLICGPILLFPACDDPLPAVVGDSSGANDAARNDSRSDHGEREDQTVATDAARDTSVSGEAGASDVAIPIDAVADATPMCNPLRSAACAASRGGPIDCRCCPAGGPAQHCLCTTKCTNDAQCPPERPLCNAPSAGAEGICTPPDFPCAWGAICADQDTPITTSRGLRRIADLLPGDEVYSVHRGRSTVVPIRCVSRVPVTGHTMVELSLATGAHLRMSPGHPTADGRPFSELGAGDVIDGTRIVSARRVPYPHPYTYDILPASSSGSYFVGNLRVGTTLERGASDDRHTVCTLVP